MYISILTYFSKVQEIGHEAVLTILIEELDAILFGVDSSVILVVVERRSLHVHEPVCRWLLPASIEAVGHGGLGFVVAGVKQGEYMLHSGVAHFSVNHQMQQVDIRKLNGIWIYGKVRVYK